MVEILFPEEDIPSVVGGFLSDPPLTNPEQKVVGATMGPGEFNWHGTPFSQATAAPGTSISELIAWPAPSPLEGVKSRKRNVFQLESAELKVESELVKMQNLALSLSSRIVAVGEAAHAAAQLLFDGGDLSVKRHQGLKVLHLAPSSFPDATSALSYAHAIGACMEQGRPHILVLSEMESSDDPAWRTVFNDLVHGQAMWKFRGAIVVCAAADNCPALQNACSELWTADRGKMQQRKYMRVSANILPDGAALLREEAARIKEIAMAADEEFFDLSFWLNKATAGDWAVTRFDACGQEGAAKLCGLVFHHMIEASAEYHVQFVYVGKELRRQGIGEQMIRWVIQDAAKKARNGV
jgi:GNAT superfamily N-acetyltransferase